MLDNAAINKICSSASFSNKHVVNTGDVPDVYGQAMDP